jgi:hypothetical protein
MDLAGAKTGNTFVGTSKWTQRVSRPQRSVRLAKEQKVTAELAAGAFRDLGIDPNKPDAAKA